MAVIAWTLLGLLCFMPYLGLRQKDVRAAWARRAEDGWSWKLLIPRPDRPSTAWAIFVGQGVLAVIWFFNGTLWLAVPRTALCLIGLGQWIWAQSPEEA